MVFQPADFNFQMEPQGLVLVSQGAEARMYECIVLGRVCVMKERFSKSYRHVDLDRQLRAKQLGNEMRAVLKCSRAGIRVGEEGLREERRGDKIFFLCGEKKLIHPNKGSHFAMGGQEKHKDVYGEDRGNDSEAMVARERR